MTAAEKVTGAQITQFRRLGWAETDAAGHNHFSVAMRWLEEAEHKLWHTLGVPEMVPDVPRVHVEIDYRERVFFGEGLTVTLGVARLGNSSCTFVWWATREDGTLLMEGEHTVVHAPSAGGSAPWPDEVRAALLIPGEAATSTTD